MQLSLEFLSNYENVRTFSVFYLLLSEKEKEKREELGCAPFLHIMWRRLSEVLIHFVGENEEEFNFLFTLLLDVSNDRG